MRYGRTRIPRTPACTKKVPCITWTPEASGGWSIFSHLECASIAKDPRLSAKRAQQMLLPLPISRQPEFSELARMLSLWLIFMDPPEHTRLRKLLNKGFSPAAVE